MLRPPTSPRARFALLVAVLALAALLTWALEDHLADPLHRAAPPPPPADPAGRSLYILLVDSLAPKDVDDMKSVKALRNGAFSATVEPCADNYTDPCTYEALTGRTTFSLFSFLDNMGVLERDKGANLISDAKRAGWSVAVISRGDMDDWGAQADVNRVVGPARRKQELRIGLEAARSHRLVFHHYVWHDVTSHRYPRGTPAYAKSLRTLETFIEGLVADLPPGTDLLITGDHGHLDDGRHLQGLDTPTEVILRSPNVVAGRPQGRIPISSVRWLAAASTGLGSEASRVAPEWRPWMADHMQDALRQSGAPLEREASDHRVPVAALATCLLLALVGGFALGWPVGLAAGVWGLGLGLVYPSLHEANLEGVGPRAWVDLTIYLPPLAGLIGLAIWRRADRGWLTVVWCSAAFGLLLFPVRGAEGVLRNAETVVIPGVFTAALMGAWVLRGTWSDGDPAARRRALMWTGVALAAAIASVWMLSFRANDVRLIGMPFGAWPRRHGMWAAVFAGFAAAGVQGLVRMEVAPVVAAALAVMVGAQLPAPVQLVVFIALVVSLIVLRGKRREQVLVPMLGLASGVMFTGAEQLGIFVTALVLGGGMRASMSLAELHPTPAAKDAAAWVAGVVLAFGAYVGMAWTLGLSVAGIDFAFVLQWLPAGWHEKLWWLIATAVFVKTFLPLFLLHTVLTTGDPEVVNRSIGRALGLVLLRSVLTGLFATGWVTTQGDSAATRRLIRVLQDGYGWLFIALAIAMLGLLPLAGRRDSEAAVAEPSSGG